MIPITNLSGRLGNQMFQFAYLYSQLKKGLIPDVYLQSEEYFENVKEEIKALYAANIGEIDMVAIHVRRAGNPYLPDEPKYAENPFYVNLMETDYYQKAMDEFPDDKFIVFSDDISWCREQDIFNKCEFSTELNDVNDMNLMASCKGIIMANSSFSWWASYLSKAKVIAPKAWYTDGVPRTKLLDSWKQI